MWTFDRALAVVGIIITIILLALDKADKLKGPAALYLLALAGAMTIPLALAIPWVSQQAGSALFVRRLLALSVVVCVYAVLAVWLAGDMSDKPIAVSEESVAKAPNTSEQKRLIVSLVQYAEMNRVQEICDGLALNLQVQMQRHIALAANPSTPFNYSQFGFELIYRAREGNWNGAVITPGSPLDKLGVHEWPNEVSFLVRTPKMSEDYAQLKSFSNNLLLPPDIKWDLDQYIHAWGEIEEVMADLLDEEVKSGNVLKSSDQASLQQKLFQRMKPLESPLLKLTNDARQYM